MMTASWRLRAAAVVVAVVVLPVVVWGQPRLSLTGSSTGVAGAPLSLTIEAYKGSGEIDTGYDGDKSLTFSGAIASPNPATNPTVADKNGIAIPFGGPTTITFVGGVAEVSGNANGVMRLYRARRDTISVTDGTLSTPAGDRLVVTVSAGPLGKFSLSLISPQLNGQTFTGANTLSALDLYGNVVTGFDASADNVTLSANAPLVGTITGLGTGSTNTLNRASDFIAGVASLTSLGMRYTGTTGAGTFTAVSVSGKSGISGSVTITAGSATRLVVTGSSAQTAGVSQNLTITAKDGANNTVAGYSGDKTLTFSGALASTNPVTQPTVRDKDGIARSFGTATTITFVGGVAQVSGSNNGVMTLYRARTDTISVSDGSVSSTGPDRLIVVVSAGTHAQFGVTLASPQTNGAVFTGSNTIEAQDAYGNRVGAFNASLDNVTVVANAPLAGSIVGLGTGGLNVLNRASDFVGGVADLTALGMKYLGSWGTGTFSVASGTGLTGTSGVVTIAPGAAVRVAFIVQPTGTEANTVIAPPVTVQLRDTSNNNVAQAGVSVTMSLGSGTGVLSGTLSRSTSASGLATFDDLKVSQSGVKRLSASSAGLTPASSAEFTIASASAPSLTFWYGKRLTFRKVGVPQRWANIFGNVSDPDGIQSLKYRLNGGAEVTLTVGPDGRRLAHTGDFIVDLAWGQLAALPDSNRVVITATDNQANTSRDTVIVRYVPSTTWPLTYDLAWSSGASLMDSAQVVDGNWTWEGNGIRTLDPGYDRLVAIGDTSWKDYEVTVPFVVHSIDSTGFSQGDPIFGLFMRWLGHTDEPVGVRQPKSGWEPFGAGAFYTWADNGANPALEIYNILMGPRKVLALGVQYVMKARVESTPQGGYYSLKVWPAGQAEPSGWELQSNGTATDPGRGSFLLLAHYADVSIGAVKVRPVTSDLMPPTISELTAIPGRYAAEIAWTTDEDATSRVEYGLTTSYGRQVVTSMPTRVHNVVLDSLQENTLYHFRVTATDPFGNASATTDRFFVTKGSSSISSDEFNAPTLNTALWTSVDPMGDGSRGVTGSQLSIGVPAGTGHDAWTGGNNAPRVIQSTNDTDFEIEVKFDAPMPSTQGAGILVQADLANYLRFDFFSDGTNTRAFVGAIASNVGTAQSNVVVGPAGAAPLYMRLKRERSVWTQWYSDNGTTWTQAFSFTYPMQMAAIGLHALNYGSSPPAFTALFDYFRNSQTPRVRLATKLLLQGPYDAGTGLMTNALRTSGALSARYPSRVIPAAAVDSITIEIRNTVTAAGSSTRKFAPAWLMRDGSIRDMTDTTKTYVEFDTTDAAFYIVVRQANHLPVMSAEAQALSVSSVTLYDFSLGLTQAYGPEAMEQVTVAGPPRYGLVAGNAAPADRRINAADRQVVKAQTGLTGYRPGDLTLNGVVDAQDQALARVNTGRETDIP